MLLSWPRQDCPPTRIHVQWPDGKFSPKATAAYSSLARRPATTSRMIFRVHARRFYRTRRRIIKCTCSSPASDGGQNTSPFTIFLKGAIYVFTRVLAICFISKYLFAEKHEIEFHLLRMSKTTWTAYNRTRTRVPPGCLKSSVSASNDDVIMTMRGALTTVTTRIVRVRVRVHERVSVTSRPGPEIAAAAAVTRVRSRTRRPSAAARR